MLETFAGWVTHPAMVVIAVVCVVGQFVVAVVSPTEKSSQNMRALSVSALQAGAALAGPEVMVAYLRVAIPAFIVVVVAVVVRLVVTLIRGRAFGDPLEARFTTGDTAPRPFHQRSRRSRGSLSI